MVLEQEMDKIKQKLGKKMKLKWRNRSESWGALNQTGSLGKH